jgi:hypothetical protein
MIVIINQSQSLFIQAGTILDSDNRKLQNAQLFGLVGIVEMVYIKFTKIDLARFLTGISGFFCWEGFW